MLLPVSAPFHCALMQPAADRLAGVLDSITVSDMKLPVIANATATANADTTQVRPLLVTQVCAPVRWEQSVVAMAAAGITSFVEIGPGKVLGGLVKRITKDVSISNIEDIAGIKAAEGRA